jgi:hypothetical protein
MITGQRGRENGRLSVADHHERRNVSDRLNGFDDY